MPSLCVDLTTNLPHHYDLTGNPHGDGEIQAAEPALVARLPVAQLRLGPTGKTAAGDTVLQFGRENAGLKLVYWKACRHVTAKLEQLTDSDYVIMNGQKVYVLKTIGHDVKSLRGEKYVYGVPIGSKRWKSAVAAGTAKLPTGVTELTTSGFCSHDKCAIRLNQRVVERDTDATIWNIFMHELTHWALRCKFFTGDRPVHSHGKEFKTLSLYLGGDGSPYYTGRAFVPDYNYIRMCRTAHMQSGSVFDGSRADGGHYYQGYMKKAQNGWMQTRRCKRCNGDIVEKKISCPTAKKKKRM